MVYHQCTRELIIKKSRKISITSNRMMTFFNLLLMNNNINDNKVNAEIAAIINKDPNSYPKYISPKKHIKQITTKKI